MSDEFVARMIGYSWWSGARDFGRPSDRKGKEMGSDLGFGVCPGVLETRSRL